MTVKAGILDRMKRTMRPSRYFTIIILVILFAVILVLLAAGLNTPSTITKINSPTDARDMLVESVEVQGNAGSHLSETPEPVAYQVAPPQDGPSLIQSHCAQCHIAQWLKQMKKSRTEWEKTLTQMEAMGVHLGDNEKLILLNYLAVADNP